MPDILIIDDELGIRKSLTSIFQDESFSVDTASSGEDGISKVKQNRYAVVILDVWLPGIDGVETLQSIKKLDKDLEIIIITGHGNVETAVKTIQLGAFDFIEKPLDLEKTMIIVKNAIKQRKLLRENRIYKESEEENLIIIGQSPIMQHLNEILEKAAPSDGRVMIFGENGTGKELAARMIHRLSERNDKPFVAVNCAAIPDDLIESELFGHKKGAFTGADTNKIGKFEQAHGGTLFLDEIGDMSLKTQAKVLRVLEEGNIQPVGDIRTIPVDVRIISATNKNIEEEISNGLFRRDLFFRLNVLPVHLPPLRERTEDIPLLLEHYQEMFSSKYRLPKKQFTAKSIDLLKNYNWPGNVRELRNILERLYIMHSASEVDISLIEKLFMNELSQENDDWFKYDSLKEAMENFEKNFIIKQLEKHGGSISITANSLGIERTSLYRKMKKHNLNGESNE